MADANDVAIAGGSRTERMNHRSLDCRRSRGAHRARSRVRFVHQLRRHQLDPRMSMSSVATFCRPDPQVSHGRGDEADLRHARAGSQAAQAAADGPQFDGRSQEPVRTPAGSSVPINPSSSALQKTVKLPASTTETANRRPSLRVTSSRGLPVGNSLPVLDPPDRLAIQVDPRAAARHAGNFEVARGGRLAVLHRHMRGDVLIGVDAVDADGSQRPCLPALSPH